MSQLPRKHGEAGQDGGDRFLPADDLSRGASQAMKPQNKMATTHRDTTTAGKLTEMGHETPDTVTSQRVPSHRHTKAKKTPAEQQSKAGTDLTHDLLSKTQTSSFRGRSVAVAGKPPIFGDKLWTK